MNQEAMPSAGWWRKLLSSEVAQAAASLIRVLYIPISAAAVASLA